MSNERYWAEHPNPRELPIRKREAWHWEAWDKEQDALTEIAGNGAAEYIDTVAVDDTGTIHVIHHRTDPRG